MFYLNNYYYVNYFYFIYKYIANVLMLKGFLFMHLLLTVEENILPKKKPSHLNYQTLSFIC